MPRDFRLLCVATFVSAFGSWLLVVALPYQVFRLTGSVTATGLMLVAESAPPLVVGPLAGLLVDRWDPVRVIVVGDAIAAIAVAGLLFGLPWLYLAVVVENVAIVFVRPAVRAMIPAIVGTGPELVRANAFIAFNGGIVRLLGPPLGALLLAWVGLPIVVWLDVLSYAAAAGLIAVIGSRPAAASGSSELWAGLVLTWQTLRSLLMVNTVFFAANGAFAALLIPMLTKRFGRPGLVSMFFLVFGMGYLIGGPVAARLVRRYRAGPMLRLALVGTGVSFLVLARAPGLFMALPIGLFGSLLLVSIETLVQRGSPEALRGRVGATFFSSDALALLVGSIVASWAGTAILPYAAAVIIGCAFCVTGTDSPPRSKGQPRSGLLSRVLARYRPRP
jgi:MFS family permease